MEIVTKERIKKTWIITRLLFFIGGTLTAAAALCGLLLYGYAALQDPPPLRVPQTAVFYGANGEVIGQANHGGQNRYWVSLDEMSEPVIEATIAVEDRRFFSHFGFDVRRIIAAALADLRALAKVEGASTITMQYARNLYLTHEKTWARKLKEAYYTILLETHYSKKTILEGYLNTIYYGHNAYGIEAAARYYFGKHAAELTLAEASMLAGIPKGPAYYSPYYNLQNANARQKQVLLAMVQAGYITKKQAEQAAKQPLSFVKHHEMKNEEPVAPYFMKTVKRILKNKLGIDEKTIRYGGLKVYTTLDQQMQKIAEKWIEKKIPQNSDIQVAFVAMDPHTGNVLALVGGRDFGKSPFNRAVQAKRQPGSTFKPFLYYAALRNGFTPSTQLLSEPTTFTYGNGQKYAPQNYGNYYANDFITFLQALALSDNVIAVKTHLFIGMEKLIKTAKKAGIESELAPIPSLALGTKPVSLLEMVRAYSAFANGGYRIEPRFITKIVDHTGEVIYRNEPDRKQVFDPQTTFVLAHMMTGTFDERLNDYTTVTGRRINDYLHRQVAGKSGTTARDSWMIGFTPQLAAGVWTGYDRGRELEPIIDTHYSKQIWGHFMKEALQGVPKKPFDPPRGVIGVYIDPHTGKLATEDCPDKRLTYYVKGTEPTVYCSDHLDVEPEKESRPKPPAKENEESLFEKLWNLFSS